MMETNKQLLERFATFIKDKDDVFLFFNEDIESDDDSNMYYCRLSFGNTYYEIILYGVDDNEIARYDYPLELFAKSKELQKTALRIFLESIKIDVLTREYDLNIEINKNKALIENTLKNFV